RPVSLRAALPIGATLPASAGRLRSPRPAPPLRGRRPCAARGRGRRRPAPPAAAATPRAWSSSVDLHHQRAQRAAHHRHPDPVEGAPGESRVVRLGDRRLGGPVGRGESRHLGGHVQPQRRLAGVLQHSLVSASGDEALPVHGDGTLLGQGVERVGAGQGIDPGGQSVGVDAVGDEVDPVPLDDDLLPRHRAGLDPLAFGRDDAPPSCQLLDRRQGGHRPITDQRLEEAPRQCGGARHRLGDRRLGDRLVDRSGKGQHADDGHDHEDQDDTPRPGDEAAEEPVGERQPGEPGDLGEKIRQDRHRHPEEEEEGDPGADPPPIRGNAETVGEEASKRLGEPERHYGAHDQADQVHQLADETPQPPAHGQGGDVEAEDEIEHLDPVVPGGADGLFDPDLHPLVGPALRLGLHHLDLAHLEGRPDVGAAVGLAVEPDDVHHPDLLHPLGDQVHLRANEVGVLQGGFPRQVDDLGGITLHELGVETTFHFLAEIDAAGAELEVHPGLAGVHVSAGDLRPEVPPHHTRERMQGGVRAHDLVAPIPVDDALHGSAGVRQFIGLDDVDDLSFPAHGVEDPQLPAVPADHPGVARLAASPGVEDGAVQDDDPVADLEDVALGPVQIAVAAGEFFDLHHQSFRWTTRATLCGPIDNRAEGPSRRHRKPHRAGRAKLSPVDAAMHRYPLECIRRQFMSKRLIRLLALLSVLAVVAAACGDGGAEDTTTSVADTTPTTEAEAPTTTEAEAPSTTAEEETPAGDFEPVPMKIGTLLPQTGQLSAIIDALLLPIDMGVEEINEAYPGLVTVEHFDSGTDPAVASENVDQILTGDFNGMIGAAASGVSTAIVDKVQTAEMAMCSGSNTGASLTQYDPYYIRTAPTDELQAPTLGDLMINDGITNAAVIWRNDEYGVGFGEALADYLE